MFLVYGVLEAVSVATDQLFGHLSDPLASAGMVPVFAVLALVGMVPTVVYLRSLREDRGIIAGKGTDDPCYGEHERDRDVHATDPRGGKDSRLLYQGLADAAVTTG